MAVIVGYQANTIAGCQAKVIKCRLWVKPGVLIYFFVYCMKDDQMTLS